MILWFSPIMIMMHGCQLQTMNDLELIKNQKHKPTKPFIAKNDKLDFYTPTILQKWQKMVKILNKVFYLFSWLGLP